LAVSCCDAGALIGPAWPRDHHSEGVESMRAFQNTKLGPAMAMTNLVYGFSITTRYGAPLITLTYHTMAEAEAAHQKMEAALTTVIEVSVPDHPLAG
jgi:hypothetical protein